MCNVCSCPGSASSPLAIGVGVWGLLESSNGELLSSVSVEIHEIPSCISPFSYPGRSEHEADTLWTGLWGIFGRAPNPEYF